MGNKSIIRIEEIDIAKGICILLMVVGHSGMKNVIHDFIYAFHMPFFFFISGVTTNVSKPFYPFLKSKVVGLLVPFMVYFIIHLPLYAYLHDLSIGGQLIRELTAKIDGALWFIPILFLSQIVNWLIPKGQFCEVVAIIGFATLSSILCLNGVHLPWNLSILGLSVSFVLMGRMLAVGGAKILFSLSKRLMMSLIALSLSASVTILISRFYHMGMYFDKIEPCLIIMAGALAGIIFVLIVSGICKRFSSRITKFFTYTGVNTFVFIGLSQLILKYENLFIYEYTGLKYVVLFIVLYSVIYVKNMIPIARKLRL